MVGNPLALDVMLYGAGQVLALGWGYAVYKISNPNGSLIEVTYRGFIPAILTPRIVRDSVIGFEYMGPKRIELPKPGVSALYWRDYSVFG